MTDGLRNTVALNFIMEFTVGFSRTPACKVNFPSVCKIAHFHLLHSCSGRLLLKKRCQSRHELMHSVRNSAICTLNSDTEKKKKEYIILSDLNWYANLVMRDPTPPQPCHEGKGS